jgi:hypothetical protein
MAVPSDQPAEVAQAVQSSASEPAAQRVIITGQRVRG